jgi:hypothetical protein
MLHVHIITVDFITIISGEALLFTSLCSFLVLLLLRPKCILLLSAYVKLLRYFQNNVPNYGVFRLKFHYVTSLASVYVSQLA